MFSKFKKVLVSLALASSLALAPMNVSAAENDGPIVGTGDATTAQNANKKDVQVPVFIVGTASDTPGYTIEVSPRLTINLNELSTSALKLIADSEEEGTDGIYMKLTEADDFGANKLQVTPQFNISDGATEIHFSAKDANQQPIDGKETMTLSELGVTSDILKFGTYTGGNFDTGSNSTSFLEDDKDKPAKNVPTIVSETVAADIRKNIPDEISTEGGIKSSSKPQIAADQQIGNVTFEIAFVTKT